MANHRGVKLCKVKGHIPKTERQMFKGHESVFTHNLALSDSSRLFRQYNAYFVQLDFSLRLRELDKPPWSWRRRRLFPSSETLLVEKVKRFNFFQTRWEGLQRNLSLTIFLCSLSVLREGTPLGKNLLACCLSQIWTPRHSLKGLWPPPYRISHLRQ